MIAGGLGGLGKCAASWLVQRGAKYLILLSRSGSSSGANKTFVTELEDLGVKVLAPKCDITDKKIIQAVLNEASKTMPPVKGCIQGTSILKVCFSRLNISQLFTGNRILSLQR